MLDNFFNKRISFTGVLAGIIISVSVYVGAGFPGLILWMAFIGLGTAASQWKIELKNSWGLGQEKRTAVHAFSNGGVAMVCGLASWMFPSHSHLFQAMIAASLASATADTLSSELGSIYGTGFINIISLKPDQRGLDGVISWEGTIIGSIGSFVIASIYSLSSGWNPIFYWIGFAGIMGNLFDSLLGATLQRRGYMNNHTVNFANTLFAAIVIYFYLK